MTKNTKIIINITWKGIKYISPDLSGHKLAALHGMTHKQYYNILIIQNFKCPISDIEYSYNKEKKKYIDPTTGIAPCIDHHHETYIIRGILPQHINQLEGTFERNSYGKISCPCEIIEYRKKYPTQELGIIIIDKLKPKNRPPSVKEKPKPKNRLHSVKEKPKPKKRLIPKKTLKNNLTPKINNLTLSWKDSVMNHCKMASQKNEIFSNQDLIKHHLPHIIGDTKSKGKTPDRTLSRTLQNLRDKNLIKFVKLGHYSVI